MFVNHFLECLFYFNSVTHNLWLTTSSGKVSCDKFKSDFVFPAIFPVIYVYSSSVMEEDMMERQDLKCSLSGFRLKNARMRLYRFMVSRHVFKLKSLIS